MIVSKNVESSRFTRYSRQGFEILQIYEIWGTYNVIARNDRGMYVWGRDYDLERGFWGGGDYRYDMNDIKDLVYGRLVIDNTGMGDIRR